MRSRRSLLCICLLRWLTIKKKQKHQKEHGKQSRRKKSENKNTRLDKRRTTKGQGKRISHSGEIKIKFNANRSTHPHPHRGYLSQLLPVPCFLPRISSLHPPSLSVAIAPSLSRHRSSFSVVLCRRWSSSFGLATVALNACGWTWTCRIRIDIIKTGLLPPTFHVLRLRPSPRIFPPPLFIDQLR